MAGRPFKDGLDYFELDCRFDDNVRLIQAEFGLKGLGVIVLLFQEIYGGRGYYMTWDEDRSLLFMSENGIARGDKNLIQEIINGCIRRGIFSEELYQKYHILTSSGIQKRYLNAVARRGNVKLKKEYLLINVGKKGINVNNNSINACNNSINVDNNSQRREEKSREEKSREKKNTAAEAARHKHGEYRHVLLTAEQYQKLCEDYGDVDTHDAIKFLDEYIEMKGYKAKNHNLALRKWVFDAVKEERRKKQNSSAYGSEWERKWDFD